MKSQGTVYSLVRKAGYLAYSQVNNWKTGDPCQITTLTTVCEQLRVFVSVNHLQVLRQQGNMHQLRERLYDCFYLLPVRRKRCAVPEVMTPGIVTTIIV